MPRGSHAPYGPVFGPLNGVPGPGPTGVELGDVDGLGDDDGLDDGDGVGCVPTSETLSTKN